MRVRESMELLGLILAGLLCGLSPRASAQGRAPELRIRSQTIRVDIRGRLATTTLEQVYINEGSWQREATFTFRLPANGTVHDLAMWVNGVRSPAVVYPRVTARRIYREIVERRRDPAILEYLGGGLWNLRIFPIPAGGTQKIQIVCTHVMPIRNGRLVYEAPTVVKSLSALDELDFSASIRCPGGVKDLRSETHKLGVHGAAGGALTAGFRVRKANPRGRISLSFVPGKPPGAVLAHRHDANRCTFWARLPSLGALLTGGARRRNFVLVLDVSASMLAHKLLWARKTADAVLAGLDANDQFAMVIARSDVTIWRDRLVPASKENVAAARAYVSKLQSSGGTDLAAALRAAETLNTEPGKPCYFVVISDGEDVVGAKGLARLSELTPPPGPQARPAKNTQIHWFCIGAGQDYSNVLAGIRGGKIWYVDYAEELEGEIAEFRRAAGEPAIEDPEVSIVGPKPMGLREACASEPLRGKELTVAGLYGKGGQVTVKLSARIDGRPVSKSFPLKLPDPAQAAGGSAWAGENLRKLWAHWRCDQIWRELQGVSAGCEQLERMVAISQRDRVVTRATAFLILETEEDYIRRGIRPAVTELADGQGLAAAKGERTARPPLPADVARQIDQLKRRARGLRKAGKYTEAAKALDDVRGLNPRDFDAGLEAAVLREFVALRAALGPISRRPAKRGPWQEMLQPVGVAGLVPTPGLDRRLPKAKALPALEDDPAVVRKLRQRLAKVEFDDIELKDVISFLREVSGLNIQVKWNSLSVAGIDRTTAVNVHLKNVTVQRALRAILEDLSSGGTTLEFTIDRNILTLSTLEDLSRRTLTLIYDVRDLVHQTVTARELLALRRRPRRASWGGRGGFFDDEGGFFDEDEGRGGGERFEDEGGWRALSREEPPGPRGPVRVGAVDGGDRGAPVRVPGPSTAGAAERESARASRAGGGADERMEDELKTRVDARWQISPRLLNDLITLLAESVDPTSWRRAGGEVGAMRDFRGLLVITQTRRNHRAVRDLLAKLRAFNPAGADVLRPGADALADPEAMFTADARPAAWVLALLRQARDKKLSKFSSVVVRKVGTRTFARIGGIWFDTALTATSRICLVARDSAAAASLLSVLDDLKPCFALGRSVVAAVAPGRAVSLDDVGITDANNVALQKLLTAAGK